MKRLFVFFFFLMGLSFILRSQHISERAVMHSRKLDTAPILVIEQSLAQKDCYFVVIAVDEFDNYDPLKSSQNLSRLRYAEKHVLRKSYSDVFPINLQGRVLAEDVKYKLASLAHKVDENSVLIVFMASHGVTTSDGQYYFITSDSPELDALHNPDSQDALSGTFLMNFFNDAGETGAQVLVFIDTCNAEGMFKDKDVNENVYCVASSERDQTAKEIETKSLFSDKLEDLFTSQDENLANGQDGYVSASSLSYLLAQAVNTHGEEYKQNVSHTDVKTFPVFKYLDYSKRLPLAGSAFLPWKVPSTEDWKCYCATACVGLEAASALSLVICASVASNSKNIIQTAEYDTHDLDRHRRQGRNASIGCIVSASTFALSYLLRFGLVECDYVHRFRNGETQNVKVSMRTALDADMVGMNLTFNF